MKKVLLISYHFPPDSEVGGLRIQKYAKYLPLVRLDAYRPYCRS